MLGISQGTVRHAIRRFEAAGSSGLKAQPVGRKTGEGRQLTAEQEPHLQKLICDKRPEQLKLNLAFWSRSAVGLLILQKCGIKMLVRSVGEYLKRWGFTPQKPIKKAYEQRPEAVKAWLDETYPQIEVQAKEEGAEIHWIDETAVVNTDVRVERTHPKGKRRWR